MSSNDEIIEYLARNYNITDVIKITNNFLKGEATFNVTYREPTYNVVYGNVIYRKLSEPKEMIVTCADLACGHPPKYETKEIGAIDE